VAVQGGMPDCRPPKPKAHWCPKSRAFLFVDCFKGFRNAGLDLTGFLPKIR
jgi:hypothetical protein